MLDVFILRFEQCYIILFVLSYLIMYFITSYRVVLYITSFMIQFDSIRFNFMCLFACLLGMVQVQETGFLVMFLLSS